MQHPSVSWHTIPLKFCNWNSVCFGQRERINVQFSDLGALMKVHPIPHVIFETTRSGFIQIFYHCSVSWNISPRYFCSSNLVFTLEKRADQKEISWLLSGWVKIHQISHIIFETTSQFFFKLCITLYCHER